MLFVRPRIIIKCAIFLAMLAFLIFFVVYGYRYDGASKAFVTHTASLHIATRADDTAIVFDTYKQTTHEESIDVYNIRPGCYEVTMGDETQTRCFDDHAYITDTYIQHVDTIPYQGNACTPIHISLDIDSARCIQDTCFGSDIISNFIIKKIGFIQTKKSLYTCDSTFMWCKKLMNISTPVVCHSDVWLHSLDTTILLR